MSLALLPKLDRKTRGTTLLTLILLSFFGISFMSGIQGYHYLVTLFLLAALVKYQNVDFPYKKITYVYLVFLLISCIYSFIYNNQPLLKTIGFCSNYLGLLFSFYLLSKNMSSRQILNCLIFLSVIYVFGYIIQWIVYPFPIFGVADNDAGSLDSYRIRISGSLCTYVLFFYGINKYVEEKKIKYIIYASLAFIPIIVMGFRTLTILSVFLTFIMIGFVKRKFTKTLYYLLFFGMLLFAASRTSIVQDKIDEMMERQEGGQTLDNPNYIRWIAYDYFTEQFFDKPGEQIIGGGVPAGTTAYAKSLSAIAQSSGLYWMDLGLVGLSWLIGIPAVLLLISIYLMCAWRCKYPSIQFVRFTIILLVVGSVLTTMELYRSGNILLFSFLLCYQFKYCQEKKLNERV